jgi:hypothetical protein
MDLSLVNNNPKDIKPVNNNFLSFSMYINANNIKKNDNNSCNINSIHKRKIYKYVDDEDVSSCNICKCTFNILRRKHHCRMCGRIFCGSCSRYKAIIDKRYSQLNIKYTKNNYFSSIKNIFGYNSLEQRVCIACYTDIQHYKKVDVILQIFMLCELTMLDILVLKRVCKLWYEAAIIYLSDFRNIQYNLPFRKLNSWETKLLWNNRLIICGHSKLMVQLILSSKLYKQNIKKQVINTLTINKHVNCSHLMCTRSCNNKLAIYDIIELLDITCEEIQDIIINILEKVTPVELECCIPIIVNKINNNKYLYTYILSYCNKHDYFKYNVLWYLQYMCNINTAKFNHKKLKAILEDDVSIYTNRFFSNFDVIDKKNIQHIINKKLKTGINKKLLLFYDKIYISRIKKINNYILRSSSNPILLPLIDNKSKCVEIILKYEDLHKDMIIINLIKLSRYILKKEFDDDFDILTYNIIPISENFGIIEKVKNSQTIFKIKKKYTIQNYILEHNSNELVYNLKMRFVKSCAAFCIITYLLGIGDRHLENIMIHKKGQLFHIDFGYILGDDPKYVNSYMRLTKEMIDTMGGENSIYYTKFKEFCIKIYNCLRRYINIYTMILLNSNIRNTDKEKIKEEIIKRFLPGQTYIEAELQLKTKMEQSAKDISYTFIDIFHSYKKTNYFAVLYDKIAS